MQINGRPVQRSEYGEVSQTQTVSPQSRFSIMQSSAKSSGRNRSDSNSKLENLKQVHMYIDGSKSHPTMPTMIDELKKKDQIIAAYANMN